jgi:hypothetical protein
MLCCAVLLQDLLVHCEQQVMRFVLRYLHSTVVEQQDVEDICNQVRSSNGYWTSAATKLTRASHGNKHYDDSVACKQTARGRRTRHKQERTCARMKRDMPGLPTPRPTLLWRPPATHISASAPPPPSCPRATCLLLPQVRFLYLDNKQLAALRHNPQLPKELLLSGSLMRLDAMDSPGLADDLEPPPRHTYCCDNKYGLPGGSTTLTVQLEDIWQHVSSGFGPGVCAGGGGWIMQALGARGLDKTGCWWGSLL